MSEDVNMLIEDNGEIKRTSAIFLNKPTSSGGYAYYASYGNYIVKCEEPVYPASGVHGSTATVEEFVSDYKSKPIMLMCSHDGLDDEYSYGLHPVVNCWYNSYYSNRLGVVYFSGYSPMQCEFDFAE